ncbi:flagellar basal body P-ring formation chaperone FlgA [Nitrosovibrio tenuis]|uniref:Flagella basal body P-ring formation protein FlgA n=1 Tax=Nitrosovibrio tenuis TaxID=1233 RepID=A0A1H7J738_9PROT|nr:flagellar basal body P-ring formation chaperone FlgA [Nitrosovibrio tenuis]SEK70498.1 flagella basal body P-ring formation protein FlgA [Nitrosovibrio tenuis]
MRIVYFGLLSCGLNLMAISYLPAAVSAPMSAKQDLGLVQETAENFLRAQSAGLPGQVEIVLGPVDARISLPTCAALEASLAPGSRAWGNTTVIVRCATLNPWTVYVRATVKVMAAYVVSAKPLTQGHILTAADLTMRSGDLSQLPTGVITNPDQAFGRTLAANLAFGSPLRKDMLRVQAAVIQNQSVKLVSSGRGFSVSAEGRALNNAEEGQLVQVRSASGSLVSGIARTGAIVEVSY